MQPEKLSNIYSRFESLFVSFNGGKDATIALFLTLIAMKKYHRRYAVHQSNINPSNASTLQNQIHSKKSISSLRLFDHVYNTSFRS